MGCRIGPDKAKLHRKVEKPKPVRKARESETEVASWFSEAGSNQGGERGRWAAEQRRAREGRERGSGEKSSADYGHRELRGPHCQLLSPPREPHQYNTSGLVMGESTRIEAVESNAQTARGEKTEATQGLVTAGSLLQRHFS